VLVCDIGGGTTDFTLIRVRRGGAPDDAGEKIQFHRVAVGNHLILGGDNLDLALARHIERKLVAGGTLPAGQWDVLVANCRRVKETLLGEDPPQRLTVNLPGRGAGLIGGSTQVEVTRDEVCQLLVDGFLPRVDLDERPWQRQSGFQEFGLPYAADSAMTRYLAAFLTAHGKGNDGSGDPAHGSAVLSRPDIVLFNGGFFASPLLRERLVEVIASWFDDAGEGQWRPVVLDNDQLHLAVARGAAYYGMVRRGQGVRIIASLARSYYIGVESAEPLAVCLVPGNAEPGDEFELQGRTFQLAISQPVEFNLYVSSTRLTDQPGDVLPIDPEQMTALPPIRTVLRTRRRSESGVVAVKLHIRLTEIGTIDLSCNAVDSDRSWTLQFDVRAASRTEIAAHETAGEAEGFIEERAWADCRRLIADVFGEQGEDKPAGLAKRLGQALAADRAQWPMSLLRRIWETLLEYEAGRRRSPEHEARWLNLLGYALRPGYGFAVDDWRVAETWRAVRGKSIHHSPAIQAESLILWRRLAGGLSAGQQLAVAEPLLVSVRGLHRRFAAGKPSAPGVYLSPEESIEAWRLLGSLELLGVPVKVELGNLLVELLPKRRLASARAAMVWGLGRLGQRVPVYGPLNTVVPAERATRWLDAILQLEHPESTDQLAAMQLARRTHDRYRDLPETLRQKTAQWLDACGRAEHLVSLVLEGGRLEQEEQGYVFGETLPKGLRVQ
jgi:hypothetical protein